MLNYLVTSLWGPLHFIAYNILVFIPAITLLKKVLPQSDKLPECLVSHDLTSSHMIRENKPASAGAVGVPAFNYTFTTNSYTVYDLYLRTWATI